MAPSRWRRLCAVTSTLWLFAGAGIVAAAFDTVATDARTLVAIAAVVAVAAAIAAWTLSLPAHASVLRWAGVALLISGLSMPTFGYAFANIVPICVGLLVAIFGSRSAE